MTTSIKEIDMDAALKIDYAARERAQEEAAFMSGMGDEDRLPQRYFASGEELSSDQLAALGWLWSYKGGSNFLNDVQRQLRAGEKSLSERQVEVVARIFAEESAKLADQADVLLNEYDALTSHPPINGCTLKGKHACKLGTPAAAKPVVNYEPVVEAGFFEYEGSIVKVQRAVHGSGNLYAKRLIVDEASKSGSFVYEAGLIRKLRESDRLTKERAVELGQLYGMCMICGATLTDETSIERGIGPVCFGKL